MDENDLPSSGDTGSTLISGYHFLHERVVMAQVKDCPISGRNFGLPLRGCHRLDDAWVTSSINAVLRIVCLRFGGGMVSFGRRRFIRLAAVGTGAVIASSLLPFELLAKTGLQYEGQAAPPIPSRDAYGYLINARGRWDCPEPPGVAIPAIINAGVLFLKAGNASSNDTGGIPRSSFVQYFKQLMNANIALGVIIDPFYPATGGVGSPRPLSDISIQAQNLKKSGYYSWIFVDHALKRSDIQGVVDTLQNAGWNLVMTNESAWGNKIQVSNPPGGVWVHTKGFDILSTSNYLTRLNSENPITSKDIAYINYIKGNFPSSYPVLKLEVPPEIDRFKTLSVSQQRSLLTYWSQNQSTYGYNMIYPLFTGMNPGSTTGSYDSIAMGTYDMQRSLLSQYG